MLPYFLIFISSVFACEIVAPEKLLLTEKKVQHSSEIIFKNCDSSSKHLFFESLNSKQIIKEIELKSFSDGTITSLSPKEIIIERLEDHLKNHPEKINLSTEKLSLTPILALKKNDRITLAKDEGKLNVLLMIDEMTGLKTIATLPIEKVEMLRIWKLNKGIRPFQVVTAQDLDEISVPAIQAQHSLSDLKDLQFYQTNKELKAGEVLKKSDLSGVTLVKAGFDTEILLENELLRIKTRGISRSHGKMGDMVEVFQPQTQKKFQGKVIDFNRIHVQL